MTQSTVAFAFVLAFAGAGCSSSTTTPGPTPADAGSHNMPPVDSGAGGVDSGGVDAASGKPATPEVLSAEPLGGGLHVMWKLNDTGLTGVELWRKKDTGAYAKAFTLPGAATSQHDSSATAPGMYCYQVKTIRGADASDMSAEKCGTP